MSSQSTKFLAAEVLRMGEKLKHPDRVGGANRISDTASRELRETFVEYSMELARRAGGEQPPRSLG